MTRDGGLRICQLATAKIINLHHFGNMTCLATWSFAPSMVQSKLSGMSGIAASR